MRLDRDPDRSPSPLSPPSDDEDSNNDVDNEAELLASMTEREAELKRTQELINERNRQVEAMLAELRRVNNLLEQLENLEPDDVNTKV